MTPYFLLRENKQSGPYSLEQLKSLDLRSSDLLWKEGANAAWRYPNEMEELLPLLETIASSKEILHLSGTEIQPDGNVLPERGINVDVPGVMNEEKHEPLTDSNKHTEATAGDSTIVDTGTKKGPIKVIIADDHSLFREGVKLALSHKADIKVIAEAENGVHLLNLLKHHKPDVILLDIEMPVMDGITALKEIRKQYGNLKVIILSMHDARSMVTTLMKTGANSYLIKSADSTTIYTAIKGVHSNDFHYTDLSSKSMIESLKETPKMVVKERAPTNTKDKSDLMLKLREGNKRHTVSRPTKKRKKKSMWLLMSSIVAAFVVLGIFHLNDQSSQNKIMFANASLDTIATRPVETLIPAEPLPQGKSQTINDLLREQDSILQSRRSINAQITQDSISPENPVSPKKKVREIKKERTVEPVSVPEPELVTEPEKPAVTEPVPVDTPVVKDKDRARYQLRNQLSVHANNYDKGVFGGVNDIQLTVTNRSSHFVNDVTIQLDYLLAGKKVHRSIVLHASDIPASSSKVIAVPRSSRGISIQYWITNCTSSELD